jgi:hypothetical protein
MRYFGLRPKRAILLLVITLATSFVQAAPRCDALFTAASSSVSLSTREVIQSYRDAHLTPSTLHQVSVQGRNYDVIGMLGESSFEVYLARDPGGKLVVIKRMIPRDFVLTKRGSRMQANDLEWIQLEALKTQFFIEKGFDLPKIIDIEISDSVGYMVKEYRLGLTADEYKELRRKGAVSGDLHVLYDNIRNMQKVYREAFVPWLKSKGLENIRLPFVNGLDINANREKLLVKGDIVDRNMLYDAETGQWIAFDP